MLWINLMAYLITDTLILAGYTPAIISEWKKWNFLCVERSKGKNVLVTELRQKIKVLFYLNLKKGIYEIYNTLAYHSYLFS
jgi:hypothetical protein